MQDFTGRFPWQASFLLTTLVYLVAGAGLWQVPCGVQLLVAMCELSRLAFLGAGAFLYLVYAGIAFGQRLQVRREAPAEATGARFNRRMFYQMLFFCLLAGVFYLAVLFDKP